MAKLACGNMVANCCDVLNGSVYFLHYFNMEFAKIFTRKVIVVNFCKIVGLWAYNGCMKKEFLKTMKYMWLMLFSVAIPEIMKNWSNDDYFRDGERIRLSWNFSRIGGANSRKWNAGLNSKKYERAGVKMPGLNSLWVDHHEMVLQVIKDIEAIEIKFESLRSYTVGLLCWCAVLFGMNSLFSVVSQWVMLAMVVLVFVRVHVKTKILVCESLILEGDMKSLMASLEIKLCDGWSDWMSEMLWVEEGCQQRISLVKEAGLSIDTPSKRKLIAL